MWFYRRLVEFVSGARGPPSRNNMEYDSDVTLPSVTNDFQDSDSEALPELVSDGDSSKEDIAI